MKRTAFLASSFSDADSALRQRFRAILTKLDYEVLEGQSVGWLLEDIGSRVNKSDIVVAVVTNRREGPSEWVRAELVMGANSGRPVLIFREGGAAAVALFQGHEQPEFDRQSIEAGDGKATARIAQIIGDRDGRTVPSADVETRLAFAQALALRFGGEVMGYFNDVLTRNRVDIEEATNFTTRADKQLKVDFRSAMNHSGFQSDSDYVLIEGDYLVGRSENEHAKYAREVLRNVRDHEFSWIVDPLDGTINFAAGLPWFGVAIGLLRGDRPVAGVIFNPIMGNLYTAGENIGAHCIDVRSGRRRRLTLEARQGHLGTSILLSHLSTRKEFRRQTIDILHELPVRGVRTLGSGQLALAGVADGQGDLFFNLSTYLWDVVAGIVIVKEAGGYFSTEIAERSEKPWFFTGPVIAARNEALGEETRRFVAASLDLR